MAESLKKFQERVNNQFFDTIYKRHKQPFYYFIGTHPHLYDGLDIDGLTIYIINNYFYEWLVNPLHFEHRFTNILNLELAKYNNIKSIELNNQILKLWTTQSNREIMRDAIRDLRTMQASKALTTSKSESKNETTADNNNRSAFLELPMEKTGNDFDETVNWGDGATNISENRNDSKTNSKTDISDTINREDAEKIANLEKKLNSGLDAYREIKGQAVTLIDNICKYLYQPKAITYLIEKLKISFYKVY